MTDIHATRSAETEAKATQPRLAGGSCCAHGHGAAATAGADDPWANLDVILTALTILGLALGAWDHLVSPLPAQLGPLGLILAFAAGGIPSAISALKSLWQDYILDIDLLMVLAAVAAAVVDNAVEGAVLLALFSAAGTLEHRAMGKARRAVEALMALRPDSAFLITPDGVVEVPVEELRPGHWVILRPGARVPVDGRIAEGDGSLDESTITGESIPVHKGPGAQVHEATVNLNGVLTVEVTRPLGESTVARMIQLVTEAQGMKAPSERFSEWFGQRYTVVVLFGSILAFFAFRWSGLSNSDALYRAATVLVAASPCAVVISVPAAILSALSAAARGGVLFKGGAALETLAEVRTFAFDKTGTLTTGKAEVTAIVPLDLPDDEFLTLLAGIESDSEHPIADAIRRAAQARALTPAPIVGVRAHPSEGITGSDAEGAIWAGNPRMAARMGARLDDPRLCDLVETSETVVYMGRGTKLMGAVAVADQPRATSRRGLEALRHAGVRHIAMMTGDRRPVALRIADSLGIGADEVHADLLPEDKVKLVDQLARAGKVAFVGDGVNDAAALARSDVGIAMGAAGSEVALQAAEVALLSEDMSRLAAAHRLARRTAMIIRQNLVFALGAMVVLVIGGAFFQLPLPLAVLGHEGGTLLVVLNGLRLLMDPIRSDRRAR